MKKLINIICINYYTENKIKVLINSILTHHSKISIYIVDNSRSIKEKNNPFKSYEEQIDITIITPLTNLGYFGGGQYALTLYREELKKSDWLAISNPDITFHDDFFENLSGLRKHRLTGAVAPKIINKPSNTNSNPYMVDRPSNRTIKRYIYIYSNKYRYMIYNIMHHIKKNIGLSSKKNNSVSKIYAAHGSFILFSNTYLNSGGDFSFEGFLFAEELFVAEEMIRLNLSIRYEQTLKIDHHEHISTSLLPNDITAGFMKKSYQLIYNKYF